MENSVDPDQIAPGALFAQTCQSKNLELLQYKWAATW